MSLIDFVRPKLDIHAYDIFLPLKIRVSEVKICHQIQDGNSWGNSTPQLVSLIEVQDILIIFQHFSSQEVFIRDRTFINFSKISRLEVNFARKTSKEVKTVVKRNVKTLKNEQIILPG